MVSPIIKQMMAGVSAAFGAFCLGASIGWSAPAQKTVQEGSIGFDVSNDEFGWISSLLTLGAACVCIPIGFFISLFGRKLTMLALVPPYLVGWLLIIFAKHVIMLYLGRFILGMCGGAFCITAPMYTTEIAEIKIRGVMGSFFQLLIVHGVLYGYILGAFLELGPYNIGCAILPIIFFVIFIWMPESPIYLAQKGKNEKAAHAYAWLRGKDYDATADIAAAGGGSDKGKTEEKPSLGKLLCRKVTLKGLGISIAMMIFQQMTGINAIIFYSTAIFEEAGTGLSPATSTIIVGVVMVLATFVSLLLIDRLGRVILLCASALMMGITTGIMGLYFFLKSNDEDSVAKIGWLPVISICVFIAFFSFGFGPVPWLIMAELFSEDVKGVAGSISGTSNWVCAFIVTKIFPLLKESIGPSWTFWIFTVIAIIAFIFIIVLVPETKGKTLDEIQGILGG